MNRANLVRSFEWNGADGVNTLKFCKHCLRKWPWINNDIDHWLNRSDSSRVRVEITSQAIEKADNLTQMYAFSSVPCGGGYICVAQYSPAMWTR